MRQITILAGGWSASQFDLRKLPGSVIAVNDAAYYAPRWDICVSMDRLWSENRFDWMKKQSKPIWLRRSTIKNFRIDELPHVRGFANSHIATDLADDPDTLDGTNSGFCALNLAYHMKPDEIFLVGFDMAIGPRGEKHWYPPYPWSQSTGAARLSEWSAQFAAPAKQCANAGISVFTAGVYSRIPTFEHIGRQTLERAAQCAA